MSRKRKDEEDKFEQELTTPEEVEQKVAEKKDDDVDDDSQNPAEPEDVVVEVIEKNDPEEEVTPDDDHNMENGHVEQEVVDEQEVIADGADEVLGEAASFSGISIDVDDYKKLAEGYDRIRAEFANYKRRIEREKEEFVDSVRAEIIREFLPIVDDFQIMLEKTEEGKNDIGLLEGAKMIFDKMIGLMDRQGLSRIDALGQPFDPQIHEALMTQPTDSEEQNEKVVQVFQEGFMLNSILIRPSKVVVGRYDGD